MPAPQWHPLALLREQLLLNLNALATRDAELASRLEAINLQDYHICGNIHQIILGRANGAAVEPLPNAVTPAAAEEIAAKLCPTSQCSEPIMIAGLDHGWLWQKIYDLETSCPRAPGHRPPLYFLARDLERLWAVLHFHDWTKLLADGRARVFAGENVIEQTTRALADNPLVPWPKYCVTVDQAIWTTGASVDSMLQSAQHMVGPRMNLLTRQLAALDAAASPRELASRFTNGKLRVLGITSRFTTFLQYSMRDWLAAFHDLGHETRLLIEQADHQLVNPLEFAEVCSHFRPDLILMIDHYRGEFAGLPQRVPCVMWVQDRLPNIYSAPAGHAQTDMDFVIGYGRQECVMSHNYPAERFMPAMVGFNEKRFARRKLSHDEVEQFSCDVSFVSHASTPPESLIQQEIEKSRSPQAASFLMGIHKRLRDIYEKGEFVSEAGHLRQIIRETMAERGIDTSNFAALTDFVAQKVNNAFFRQQAIEWVSQMGVKLHLYGRGWENDERFRQFARGIADNERQLGAIYQASTINLQVTPFGSVHQRLCDGLSAGGFFLLRHCTGDACDRILQQLWDWVTAKGIGSGEQLLRQASPEVSGMLDELVRLSGEAIEPIAERFFFGLEEVALGGFTRSASTLWAEYDRVMFSTREQLQSRVKYFLEHGEERREIAASMRQRALEFMSYTGITRRMLQYIARELAAPRAISAAA